MSTTGVSKFAFVCLCLFAAGQALAGEPVPQVREVVVGVSDAFVPGGFDSQSEAYVVVSGIFPNGCYRWKGADVKHLDSLNHEIRSLALVSQGMCTMSLIPFTQEVRLGVMETGTHHLRFVGGDGTYLQKTLTVE